MTTGLEAKIQRALEQHLNLFIAAQASTERLVAYPGVKFTPPSDGKTMYYRPTILPATPSVFSLDEATEDHSGIFQVDVFYPEGSGSLKPVEKAAAIIAHYRRRELTHEGVMVRVNRPPYSTAPLQEPGWYQVPVSIPYRAFIRS